MRKWIKAEKGAWIVFWCLLAGLLLPSEFLVVAAVAVLLYLLIRSDKNNPRPV